MSSRARIFGDLILAVLVMAGSALLLFGSVDLPPPRFEPLGSAALPRILAAILICLSLGIVARAVLALRDAAPADPVDPGEAAPGHGSRPWAGAATLVALVLYVGALDVFRAPFVPATAAFLGVIGLALTGGSLRAAVIYTLVGALLGAGLSYILSTFLYVTIG